MRPAAKRLRDKTLSALLDDRTAAGLRPIAAGLSPAAWERLESILSESKPLTGSAAKAHKPTRKSESKS